MANPLFFFFCHFYAMILGVNIELYQKSERCTLAPLCFNHCLFLLECEHRLGKKFDLFYSI